MKMRLDLPGGLDATVLAESFFIGEARDDFGGNNALVILMEIEGIPYSVVIDDKESVDEMITCLTESRKNLWPETSH